MIRVTQLARHDDTPRPYYTARVHAGEHHFEVDNRHGSWQTSPNGRPAREVRPEVAAELQRRLPREARRRR